MRKVLAQFLDSWLHDTGMEEHMPAEMYSLEGLQDSISDEHVEQVENALERLRKEES